MMVSVLLVLLAPAVSLTALIAFHSNQQIHAAGRLESAFQQAAQEFNVSEDLLKSICQVEAHISIHNGTPSINGGYGCNLVKNKRVDTLDRAARWLGVAPQQLQRDLAANIRGMAYILSDDALQLSPTHQFPTTLAGWRPAIEVFSNAQSRYTAHLYSHEVYQLLQNGFSTQTESGEIISVKSQTMPANTAATPLNNDPVQVANLPVGCSNDGKTDYPGAIDCILNPAQHDCDLVPRTNASCNYFSSNHYSPTYRQNDSTITHVVIHDIEGTGVSAINTFEDPNSNASAHYVIDSDGTVYQVVHEKDIAFQAGNLWFNQHSVGIEHAGFAATGFQWYNATEYLASAKLVAYLLNKYHIPLEHNHIVSHGTIPASNLASTPNHVDPGPYWLWDYYLNLIGIQQKQAAPPNVALSEKSHIITLHPITDLAPFNKNGTETPANFNFFYLYNGPSTKSGLIPQEGARSDITDETDNVESAISYYYVNKAQDPAGTGDTLYEIWYGESDQAHASTPSFFMHAKLAWLAVPPATARQGKGTVVRLKSSDGKPVQVSGKSGANTATTDYHIGDAPNGSVFISEYKVVEDGKKNIWYSINYNHRLAWVPASNVVKISQS